MFATKPVRLRSEIVDSPKKLRRLYSRMMKLEEFAYDTETNTLRVLGDDPNFRLVGISISWGAYHNYYIPVGHIREEDLDRQLDLDEVVAYMKPVFEREDVRIIGHNLKFDMHVMSRVGVHIRTRDLFDTMIASWLCDENTPNGLKENSAEKLGIDQTHFAEAVDNVPKEVKKQFGLKANSRATFDMTLIDESAPYALDDAFYTFELYKGFLDELEEQEMDKIYNKLYVPFLRTIFDMERKGVTVDTDRLDEMSREINEDMENLQYQLIELAGVEVSLSSSQQLAELLFGYRKKARDGSEGKVNENILAKSFNFRTLSTTAGGAPQTNADVLWRLSNMSFKDKRKKEGVEFCKLMLEYKKLDKLRSAFIDGLKVQLYSDGKAHPSFNIIGTDSGRLSCSNPNLQQLPKADEEDKYQIRSLFIGSIDPVTEKRKKIVALDFANLEMRVLAHFSEDKNLLEMFAKGYDTHGSTAVNMFGLDCSTEEVKKKYPHLRQAAKVLNFLLMYGGGASRLYEQLKSDHGHPIDLGDKSYLDTYKVKSGLDVAQIYIDKYFETYSGVAKFIRNQKRFAHKYGYVYTLLKRKRRLPDINSSDFKAQAYCERLSVNSAIQGSAADLTMSAQNRVSADPWFEEHRINMLLQVHDELVFECPEEYVDECIKKVQQYMSHPFGDNVELNLPMRADADFGDSYQEAK
jgi:DNA polymerase-1